MKKVFTKPELQFIKLDVSDVITTSGGPMLGAGSDDTAGYGALKTFGFNGGLGQPMQ